jgi:lysophospholipase L1-like esterase
MDRRCPAVRGAQGARTAGLAALLALALAQAPARADLLTIAAMGDSLTDTYAGHPQLGGNRSWTDQFKALRAGRVHIINVAAYGSTSADLLAQGQHTRVADLVRGGNVHYATLMIGANDMLAYLSQIDPKNPATFNSSPFVNALAADVRTALDTVRAAGNVAVAVANVPDIGATPALQQALGKTPAVFGLITAATRSANARIEALAQARGLPVVDLYRLNDLPQHPLTLGGTLVNGHLYAPEGFHPSTIGQGLIANTILEAFHVANHLDIQPYRLSDQDILNEAGLPYAGGPAFNAAAFVQFQSVPEPSTLALLAVGALGPAGYRRRVCEEEGHHE